MGRVGQVGDIVGRVNRYPLHTAEHHFNWSFWHNMW